MNKIYLGDSVYAEYDGDGFILTISNGGPPSDEIYLEWEVLYNLQRFVQSIKARDINTHLDETK